jgi:hypothetical protein
MTPYSGRSATFSHAGPYASKQEIFGRNVGSVKQVAARSSADITQRG